MWWRGRVETKKVPTGFLPRRRPISGKDHTCRNNHSLGAFLAEGKARRAIFSRLRPAETNPRREPPASWAVQRSARHARQARLGRQPADHPRLERGMLRVRLPPEPLEGTALPWW